MKESSRRDVIYEIEGEAKETKGSEGRKEKTARKRIHAKKEKKKKGLDEKILIEINEEK